MRFVKKLIIPLAVFGCLKTGAQDIEGYRFTDFPATSSTLSKSVNPDFSGSPSMKKYKANILKRYTGKVNFGGAYQVVTWGCGTGCLTGAVVDLRNGKVYELPELGANNCGRESVHAKDDRMIIRKNSRLLLSAGCGTPEGDNPSEVNYKAYEWDEQRKAFIITVKKYGKL